MNVVNALKGELPYSLKTAYQTDFDFLKELQHWKSKLPQGIGTAWVKAYQTKYITREARLNCIVDHLASTQHSAEIEWESTAAS